MRTKPACLRQPHPGARVCCNVLPIAFAALLAPMAPAQVRAVVSIPNASQYLANCSKQRARIGRRRGCKRLAPAFSSCNLRFHPIPLFWDTIHAGIGLIWCGNCVTHSRRLYPSRLHVWSLSLVSQRLCVAFQLCTLATGRRRRIEDVG